MVFGVAGACRSDELCNMTTDNVSTFNSKNEAMLVVNVLNTKTKINRSFTISREFYDIVTKYKALRPLNCKADRFFLNFLKGECTQQPIGHNKFAAMPKQIAEYLDLPESHLYTGHSFRRTLATILANSGCNITTLKRHGGWKSATVAERLHRGISSLVLAVISLITP